jgi:hypothetical protein
LLFSRQAVIVGAVMTRKTKSRPRRLLKWTGLLLAVWALAAYIALPLLWTHYEHQPRLASAPMVTKTGSGIPGDALNVGLVGDRENVVRAFHIAGWFPADPITLKTSAEIVGSVLLDRPYKHAPVSPLYYDGRREDLAFERPDGKSARKRHHIRLWQVLDKGQEGRPVWLGSATFDQGVGLSHYTGQVTHDIAPDIDAERDFVTASLERARMVVTEYQVTGVGPTLNGRNGEGSPYYTDGEVEVLVLAANGRPSDRPVERLGAPAIVQAKDAIWKTAVNILNPAPASSENIAGNQ